MTVRYAWQGQVQTHTPKYPGIKYVQVIEAPAWQRPAWSSTGFIVREYHPVRWDHNTQTATCCLRAVYWVAR